MARSPWPPPPECFKRTLDLCVPLFSLSGNHYSILLSPLPRYITGSCCQDNEHCSNRDQPDFDVKMMQGLDDLKRICKDHLHRRDVSPSVVINTLQLMVDPKGGIKTTAEHLAAAKQAWGEDPVHPSNSLFLSAANNLLSGCISSMLKNNSNKILADGKTVARRPAWLTAGHTCTTPRGRGRGRRGRGGW